MQAAAKVITIFLIFSRPY